MKNPSFNKPRQHQLKLLFQGHFFYHFVYEKPVLQQTTSAPTETPFPRSFSSITLFMKNPSFNKPRQHQLKLLFQGHFFYHFVYEKPVLQQTTSAPTETPFPRSFSSITLFMKNTSFNKPRQHQLKLLFQGHFFYHFVYEKPFLQQTTSAPTETPFPRSFLLSLCL